MHPDSYRSRSERVTCSGRMTGIDRDGQGWTLGYNPAGQVTSVTGVAAVTWGTSTTPPAGARRGAGRNCTERGGRVGRRRRPPRIGAGGGGWVDPQSVA